MSRPVILYQELTLPAATLGPPIQPSRTVSDRELLKAPERMLVDHIAFNLLGIENAGILRPSQIMVKITTKDRTAWHENFLPLENYHNVTRERVERNIFGPYLQQTIQAGASWIVPAGKWQITAPTGGEVQQLAPPPINAWVGNGVACGVVNSDGVGVQVTNFAQQAITIAYRRVTSFESGVWWMAENFRLEKTHSLSLNIQNRMANAVHFFITFQVMGEQTKRVYVLAQEVSLAAGARSPFAGTDLSVTFEEAVLIQQMSFCPHPDSSNFDPAYIDLQIEPSQGGSWSEDLVPLIGYANLRGQFVDAMHKPVQDVVLDVNEFLRFEFENWATEPNANQANQPARTMQLVIVGHTI